MGLGDFISRSFKNRHARRRDKALARSRAKRQTHLMAAGNALQLESLEPRVLLSGNALADPLDDPLAVEQTGLVITVTPGVTTIHDETDGLQNTPPNLDPAIDENGNDVALDLDGTDPDVPDFPVAFSSRLTALGSDPSGAIGAALSGYDGSNDGLVALTINGNGFTIANLALTDEFGDLLNGLDSGVTTTDGGNNIFLFTDTENDNIVLGREGTGATADANGDIVLAIYLQEIPQAIDFINVKLWTVQYEAVFHNEPGDGTTPQGSHDEFEPVDLTGNIFATAFRDLEFDLTNAPAGQNLFITFGDGDIADPPDPTEVGIVATGRDPANQSEGENITTGDTVNTSQAGSNPTVFGVNNQKVDELEGLYFTFITGPTKGVTVPELDQNEADVESNIQFTDFLDADAAEFQVVQLQPASGTSVVKVSAFNEEQDPASVSGAGFVDSLNNDTPVAIESVVVVDADGGGELNGTDNGDGTFTILPDPGNDFVIITGVEAGDTIRYTTVSDHNRVLIENAADGSQVVGSDFDIGGFKLIQADFASADVGVTFFFEDDGPTIDVQIVAAADPLVVDESDLTIDASADFSDNFSVTSDGGADGTDNIATSYVLSVGTAGPATNLVDVATGQTVVLVDNGGVIEGRTAISDDLVFVVSVDGSGTVTLDQQRALEHPDATDPDDAVTLDADLIVLTRTDTITDGDGDTASDSEGLDIGVAMTFHDDGPTIDVQIVAAADPLVVDETDLTVDASADFSDNFSVTSDGGADGTASIVTSYALSVGTAGPATNLVDVATGQTVVLSVNGGDIEGRTETSDDLVFVVSVDGSGTVTLDQQRALEHPDATDPDDAVTLDADLIVLTRTDTITDGDGDTASDSEGLDIGAAMTFHDDGPAIDVQIVAAADPLVVDESDLTIDASADFSDNFSVVSDGGADGTASIVTSYALSVGTAGPATNLVDVATGQTVVLVDNGGVIEGRTAISDDLVFVVSVDGSGTVTLDQQRALEHPDTTDPDDTVTLDADLIVLTRTDTITDGDGDTASDSEALDIGVAMSFDDDGPTIDVQIVAAADPLVVDESDLTIDASADFSDNFSVVSDGGADGTASIVTSYALSVGTAGPATNLVDVATGQTVVLSVNGSDIEGRTETSDDLVFVVSVDVSGTVTLDQQRALVHPDTTDPDDTVTLDADLIVLTRTDTITDGDGDTASDSEALDIGVAMTFHDDGPAIDVQIVAAADPLVVDESDLTIDASADFSDNFSVTSDGGADGTDNTATSYVLSVGTAGPATNLVDVATGQTVVLVDNGGVIEGRTAISDDLVFVVSVDGSGTVTLDQQRALEHPDTTDPDDAVTLDADLIVLTRMDTITDGDGDTASDSEALDIGAAMSFHDDGPAIDVQIVAAADPLVVDESDLTIDASADFSDNFSVTSDGGADGTDNTATSYVLSVGTAGPATNLVDVATGQTVVLVDNGGVIEGRTAISDDLVFVVSVDGSGTVTLDQQRALEHPDATDPDDAVTLDADLIVLTRMDTITDGDGDTASDSEALDIGAAMSFHDDGPAIDVQIVAAADPLVVDESDLTIDASADFSDNFSVTSDGGADGTDNIATSYVLSVGTAGPATNLIDVATGQTVVLVDNGGVIEGRTAISDDLVFVVSVDGSGTVTLDQQRALVHPDTTDPDDTVTLDADLIVLTRTDTITDGDGDTANDSEALDIGVAMSFDDDGSAIEIETIVVVPPPLVVDETDLTTDASADFSNNFSIIEFSFGADGAGTITSEFTLSVSSDGVDSGLDDVATGEDVLLSVNGSGDVEGRTATSDLLVFVVSVDGSGTVTLDQQRALEHPDATDPNDVVSVLGGRITLTRTDTITDGDGDSAEDSAFIDLGPILEFLDDGPALEFSNLVGAVTTTPQVGFWDSSDGADQPGTLSIVAVDADPTADGIQFEMETSEGVVTTGTIVDFDFDGTVGTGKLVADFDNDPANGDETIGFTQTLNDDGTYEFALDQVIVETVTLSTDQGQLPAGGPDPVQTLGFGEDPENPDTTFVFFAVDAATAEDPSNPIVPAIELGEPDLDELTLQCLSAMEDCDGNGTPGDETFGFIRDEIAMNVSTSGIGVNNNVLQGEALDTEVSPDPGDTFIGNINPFDSEAFDESFVINPEPLASVVKVFVSKTAGGFSPPGSGATLAKTDYLYFNLYDEVGNNTGPILVLAENRMNEADVANGGTGENLWSFTIDINTLEEDFGITGDFGNFIDALQLTMGFGNIKIPRIEVVVRGDNPPNDIFLDFSATLTDADGDTATSAFAIDLYGNDVDQAFDYTLIDAEAGDDAFNIDLAAEPTEYFVQGFTPDEDKLVLSQRFRCRHRH